jgi:hypothetical protein
MKRRFGAGASTKRPPARPQTADATTTPPGPPARNKVTRDTCRRVLRRPPLHLARARRHPLHRSSLDRARPPHPTRPGWHR